MKTTQAAIALSAALGLMGMAPMMAHAEEAAPGRWSVDETTSALDDSKTYVATLESANRVPNAIGREETVTLIIRCKGGTLAAYAAWPRYFGSDPVAVAWKLDDGPIVHDTWDVSSSGKSLGFFDQGLTLTLIHKLRSAHRLVMQASPYEAGSLEAVFDLGGVAEVADHALTACHAA